LKENVTTEHHVTDLALNLPSVHTTVSSTGKPAVMMKRIGSTTYQVAVYFSKTSKETMSDKISRLIRNEADNGKAAIL